MTLASALSFYIVLNVLVVVATVGLGLYSRVVGRNGSARSELSLHYFTLGAVIIVASILSLLPTKPVFQPPAKVWSAATFKESAHATSGPRLVLKSMRSDVSVDAERASTSLALIALALLALGALRILHDLVQLWRIRSRSFLLKKIGPVSIYANDRIAVPFSHWVPFRNDVVVPFSVVLQSHDYRTIVAHELQHHRQGDTRWIYAMYALRVACVANPFIHLWNRSLSEIQEFACDETLVDLKRVESREYARCLVEVAQTAKSRSLRPACATGLVFLSDRKLLRRRIENMMKPTRTMGHGAKRWAAGILTIAMAGAAFASQGMVQDRRVTMSEAKTMLANAKATSTFPIVINEAVLRQLNRYVGTPEGREFMRDSLMRMESHRAVIEAKVKHYGVPSELLAVPITESGYKNMSQAESGTSMKSAGLWQFIPSTARRYGLRVDAQRDERLDVELETDAAVRYLESNYLRFRDWHLALLAYNMGENAVQNAMDSTGAKDAWTLIRLGHEGDKDYLPKLMAALLIMKNPESVK